MDTTLHRHLLRAFLDPSLSLPDLAESHGLDLADLAEWSLLPETIADLDALERLAARRLRALAAEHAPTAIATLATLMTAPNPEIARKAASALLRLIGKGPAAPVRSDDHTLAPRQEPPPPASRAANPAPIDSEGEEQAPTPAHHAPSPTAPAVAGRDPATVLRTDRRSDGRTPRRLLAHAGAITSDNAR